MAGNSHSIGANVEIQPSNGFNYHFVNSSLGSILLNVHPAVSILLNTLPLPERAPHFNQSVGQFFVAPNTSDCHINGSLRSYCKL